MVHGVLRLQEIIHGVIGGVGAGQGWRNARACWAIDSRVGFIVASCGVVEVARVGGLRNQNWFVSVASRLRWIKDLHVVRTAGEVCHVRACGRDG